LTLKELTKLIADHGKGLQQGLIRQIAAAAIELDDSYHVGAAAHRG
jgi:hypothetical protein